MTMRSFFVALSLGWLLVGACATTPVLAQGCGQGNPNCVAPTPPLGDDSSRIATTDFFVKSIAGGLPLPNNNIYIGNPSNLAQGSLVTGDCNFAFLAGNALARCIGTSLNTQILFNNAGAMGGYGIGTGLVVSGGNLNANFAAPPALGGTTPAPVTATALTATGGVFLGGQTPTQTISSTQNNYDPTGDQSWETVLIDPGASDQHITGLARGGSNRPVRIVNKGTLGGNVIIDKLSGSSLAANQFALQNNVTIPPNGGAFAIQYDNVSLVWRPWGGELSNTGVSTSSCGSATQACTVQFGVDGRAISAAPTTIAPALGSVTGWGTGVLAAVGTNVGSAGAPVLFNGALGTPSSGTIGTGLTLGGVTTGLGSDR
jgi:hypothetical protein